MTKGLRVYYGFMSEGRDGRGTEGLGLVDREFELVPGCEERFMRGGTGCVGCVRPATGGEMEPGWLEGSSCVRRELGSETGNLTVQRGRGAGDGSVEGVGPQKRGEEVEEVYGRREVNRRGTGDTTCGDGGGGGPVR